MDLHFVGGVSEHDVPDAVISFLSKSDKLVPVHSLPSWRTFYDAIDDFHRRLRMKFAFRARRWLQNDPLAGLRRKFFKPSSTWMPSLDQVPEFIEKYETATRGDLCWSFYCAKRVERGSALMRNLSFADHWAMKWLSSHTSIMDAPSDKSLGTAVLTKACYDELAFKALQKSYQSVDEAATHRIVQNAQKLIRNVLAFAKPFQILHPRVCDFAICLFDEAEAHIPIGRQLIKVHKPALESRMIASGVRWITNPIAVIVAKQLQPIVNSFKAVARDTAEVINAVESIPTEMPASSHAATFDVKDLYPSIEFGPCMAALKVVLYEYFTQHPVAYAGVLVEVLLNFVDIIFQSQLLRYRSQVSDEVFFYLQTTGITTGLSCATQLANVFLHGLDKLILRDFRCHVLCYKRFVDDILVIVNALAMLQQIMLAMNTWQQRITVTHDADEDSKHVHFLDLWLRLDKEKVHFATYHKPNCLYMYTPFNSCHPLNVKRGIVMTELTRLLLTNSSEASFNLNRDLLFQKLMARGYPRYFLDAVAQERQWCHKQSTTTSRGDRSSVCVVPFKLKCSPALAHVKITKILNRLAFSIFEGDSVQINLVTCFLSNPNLFRMRFARFV